MDNLLDTHTLLWYLEGNAQITSLCRNRIEAKTSFNFVSLASLWEIAIKISLDKLEMTVPFSNFVSKIEENGFSLLPIDPKDTLIVSTLPFHHRDPFDSLIISQAMNNNLVLLSKDSCFKDYKVSVIW